MNSYGFFHIWIHVFHEFIYQFGCTKVPDALLPCCGGSGSSLAILQPWQLQWQQPWLGAHRAKYPNQYFALILEDVRHCWCYILTSSRTHRTSLTVPDSGLELVCWQYYSVIFLQLAAFTGRARLSLNPLFITVCVTRLLLLIVLLKFLASHWLTDLPGPGCPLLDPIWTLWLGS